MTTNTTTTTDDLSDIDGLSFDEPELVLEPRATRDSLSRWSREALAEYAALHERKLVALRARLG